MYFEIIKKQKEVYSMLQITARLFKDNQLYGYRITDGQQIIDATKAQAWLFAKQKEILNVNATGSGNEGDYGLTGTNGFELKSLPQIKWEGATTNQTVKKEGKYDAEDMQAALMYHMALEPKVQSLKDWAASVAEFTKLGIIQDFDEKNQKFKEYMKNLLKKRAEEPDFLRRRRSLTPLLIVTHRIMVADRLVGYTIKNASISQIIFARDSLSSYTRAQAEYLAPWESVDISRVEMVETLSLPEYSGRFQNGKIVVPLPDRNCKTVVDWIMRGYILCNNETPAKQLEVNENTVKYIVNNKTMKELMKTSESDAKFLKNLALQYKEKSKEAEESLLRSADDLVRQTKRTQKEVKQKQKEIGGIRKIFDTFNC